MDRLAAAAAMCLLCLSVLATTLVPAFAQLPGLGTTTTTAETTGESGYQSLIDQAVRDGSTVIVISPDQPAGGDASDSAMAMPDTRFLEARWKFRALIASLPELLGQSIDHLNGIGPNGSYGWLLQALLVAAFGIFVSHFTNRYIRSWMRRHFAPSFVENPKSQGQKISYLMLRAGLVIFGNVLFFAVAMIVAIILDNEFEPTRATIFAIISSFVIYRMIRYGFLLNLFAPDLPRHRLITLPDEEARPLYNSWWMVTFVSVLLFGIAGWARALDVPKDAQEVLLIIAILLCGWLITALTIVHRKAFGHILAGNATDSTTVERRRILTILAVPASIVYLVFASILSIYRIVLDIPGGFLAIMAPIIIVMFAVAAYGITFVLIDWFYTRRQRYFEQKRAEALERNRREQEAYDAAMEEFIKSDLGENEEMRISPPRPNQERLFEYQPLFREFFERSAVGIIAALSLGEFSRLLGVDIGREGGHWLAIIIDVALVAYIAYQLLLVVNRFIDVKIEEEGGTPAGEDPQPGEGEGGVGQSRLATLLPIARNVLFSIVVMIAAAIGLASMGVDVAPLFAGAGVVGIAIGFGAQTLIRDIFSGAFFLMDDAFRKGEYVALDNVKGVVEKISIRSFQLRHHLGALHTVPFGEIKSLTNFSRDWVMMKLPIRLTYDTDVDRVRKLVKKLGQELLEHPDIGDSFLQPLKSQGVYKMEDSAMIIRVKFMTRPGEQFIARKVIYEKIRQLFEKEGIRFAHKEVTVRLPDDKKASDLTEEERSAVAAAARRAVDDEEAAQAATQPAAE